MANYYINAFYAPTTTSTVTVFSCPANSRAIIQNIQIANTAGSKNVTVTVNQASTSTNFLIAYASITGPTTCNLAEGPIILQESDTIGIASSNVSYITGTISQSLTTPSVNAEENGCALQNTLRDTLTIINQQLNPPICANLNSGVTPLVVEFNKIGALLSS